MALESLLIGGALGYLIAKLREDGKSLPDVINVGIQQSVIDLSVTHDNEPFEIPGNYFYVSPESYIDDGETPDGYATRVWVKFNNKEQPRIPILHGGSMWWFPIKISGLFERFFITNTTNGADGKLVILTSEIFNIEYTGYSWYESAGPPY